MIEVFSPFDKYIVQSSAKITHTFTMLLDSYAVAYRSNFPKILFQNQISFVVEGPGGIVFCSTLLRSVTATLLAHWEACREKASSNSPLHLYTSQRLMTVMSKVSRVNILLRRRNICRIVRKEFKQ